MKSLLIGGSLAVNVALVTALVVRPSLAPAAVRRFMPGSAEGGEVTQATKPAAPKRATKVWAQLETSDLKQLVLRLRAAGFPANVIRNVVQSLVSERYSARIRALIEPDPNTPYWQMHPFFSFGDKRFAEVMQLEQERARLIRDLLNDPALANTEISATDRRRYGNLPAAKIDLIRRIEEDYNDMTNAVRAGTKGIVLPEDQEKFDLLAKEKRADLEGVLTPDEYADYAMRTATITNILQSRFETFEPTEGEFRAIYQAYQSTNEKFGAVGPSGMDQTARESAQQLLTSQIQSALGTYRYDQMVRAMSDDYRSFQQIADKQNLPAGTADQAYALRDAVARESLQIVNDPNLAPADKRSQLKLLADNTRIQLTMLLPGEAGQTYANQANWLRILSRGAGVNITSTPPLILTTPQGTISAYTVTQARPVPVVRGRRGPG